MIRIGADKQTAPPSTGGANLCPFFLFFFFEEEEDEELDEWTRGKTRRKCLIDKA